MKNKHNPQIFTLPWSGVIRGASTTHTDHTFPQPHHDEGCEKCGGFSGEPCEPPASRRLKRLYLTKEAGDNLWHWVGDPVHPNTTLDVGMVTITGRDEIKVDASGTYVLRGIEQLEKLIS